MRDVVLGTLKVYYDPDMQLTNNRFCFLGFRSNLILSQNGGSEVTLIYDQDYKIDPDTFEIKLLNFAGG